MSKSHAKFGYRGISNIALDTVTLSKSVADKVVRDGKKRPVCLTGRAGSRDGPFCSYFYESYQQLYGNAASLNKSLIIQPMNLSFPGEMEKEFADIFKDLDEQGYEPDSLITVSGQVFSTINNVNFIYNNLFN